MGFLPSGDVKIAIEHGPVEIVSCPCYTILVIFHNYVSLPEDNVLERIIAKNQQKSRDPKDQHVSGPLVGRHPDRYDKFEEC